METAAVVVIGGGAAGLAAFQTLRAAGCDALLVEARGRWGGRILTVHPEDWPLPVELGAEFIHGEAAVLGLPVAPAAPGRDWSWREGRLQRAAEFAGGADAVFERMTAWRGPDLSFAAFLDACGDLDVAARVGAAAFIEGYEAADPARISVVSLNREFAAIDGRGPQRGCAARPAYAHSGLGPQSPQPELRFAGEGDSGPLPLRPAGGYGHLLEALQAEGRKRLNWPVQAVAWKRGTVRLTGPGGETIEARRAIITLPLSILQRGQVRFGPALDAKREALDRLAMGGALRITLRLRSAFWRGLRDSEGETLDDLRFLFGQNTEAGHFSTWWTHSAGVHGQIVGWAGGRHAWSLAGLSAAALTKRACADLAERLGVTVEAVQREMISAYVHDWQTDPRSLGAYSYATVGGADAFAALAEPLLETLFFAGEATDATGHHATVPGAVASGRRVAAETLRGA